MGIGGLHIWHLLVLLLIVILLFGTNKLRGIGADLGSVIRGFRSSIREGEGMSKKAKPEEPSAPAPAEEGRVIDGQSSRDAPKS